MVVVPLPAIAARLVWGPRARITGTVVLASLVWPVVWLTGTVTIGAVTGWYPNPFLDVGSWAWAGSLLPPGRSPC